MRELLVKPMVPLQKERGCTSAAPLAVSSEDSNSQKQSSNEPKQARGSELFTNRNVCS